MKKLKICDEVLVFVSDVYFGVNITVLSSGSECIIVDAGMSEKEIREVINYIEISKLRIKYLVYTHMHFDHIFGEKWIDRRNIRVVTHSRFKRNLLLNICNLEDSEELNYSLGIPDITFDTTCRLYYGNSSILLMSAPGHTSDSLIVLAENKNVLIAGDTVNYIPYIRWGDLFQLNKTLSKIENLNYKFLVMGHYGFVSKKESEIIIKSNIDYLQKINENIDRFVKRYYCEKDGVINIELNEEFRVPASLYYKNCDYSFIKNLHEKNVIHLLKMKIQHYLGQ